MLVHFQWVVQGASLQVFVGLASWVVATVAVHGARIQEVDPCEDHQDKQELSNQIFCNRSSNSKDSNNKSHKYSRLPNSRNYNSNNKNNSKSHLNNHSDNHSDNHSNFHNHR